jgi:FkbM family methyltransferase
MYLDTADPFQCEMACGNYQPCVVEQILALARPGDVVLTAGAHLGYTVLALAKVIGLTGKILAFEADPRMVERCQRNLELNHIEDIVRLFPFALGRSDGQLQMSISLTAGQSSFAIEHHHLGYASVEVKNGDELLAGLGVNRIDGLVLDVEGWEMQVLDGLARTLSVTPPRWAIVECWDVALKSAGSSARELLSRLATYGWNLRSAEGGVASDGCDIVCTRN